MTPLECGRRCKARSASDVSLDTLEAGPTAQTSTAQPTNDIAGIEALTARMLELAPSLVVLKATGGYEFEAACALQAAGLAVVNARRARDSARAMGALAQRAGRRGGTILTAPRRTHPTRLMPPAPPHPGFDGLRLLAACAVLLAHAMLMPRGDVGLSPLEAALEQGGLLAVGVFFIVSGFLLAGSLERDGDALRFAVHRVLRIVPGLAVCALFTAFVLGAFGTSLPLADYLRHPETTVYIATTLDCLCTRGWLPGVWAYQGNPEMQPVVNGSLWSLSYEALTYVLLLALWLLTRRVGAVAAALLALAGLTALWPPAHEALQSLAFTLPAFAAGVALHALARRHALRADLAALCAAAFVAAAALGHAWAALCTVGAYAVVWAGTRANPLSRVAARHGDLSYGVYLYGWPVQQLVRTALPEAMPWTLLAASLPPVLLLAALSHHLVERPALRARHAVIAGLQRFARAVGPLGRQCAGAAFVLGSAAWLMAPKLSWWVARGLVGLALLAALAALLGGLLASNRRVPPVG